MKHKNTSLLRCAHAALFRPGRGARIDPRGQWVVHGLCLLLGPVSSCPTGDACWTKAGSVPSSCRKPCGSLPVTNKVGPGLGWCWRFRSGFFPGFFTKGPDRHLSRALFPCPLPHSGSPASCRPHPALPQPGLRVTFLPRKPYFHACALHAHTHTRPFRSHVV